MEKALAVYMPENHLSEKNLNPVQLFNLINGDSENWGDKLKETVEIIGFVLIPQEDETGTQYTRALVQTADGKFLSVSSKTVNRQFAQLESIFGAAPWEPALKCHLEQHRGNGVNKFYKLVLE